MAVKNKKADKTKEYGGLICYNFRITLLLVIKFVS